MEHDNYSQTASDIIGPPKKVNSLQALANLEPIPGKEWNVLAYVLNRDMINEDGTLDDLHGIVFPLGSFKNRSEAEKHAKNVIQKTGHPSVITCAYGYPVRLTTKCDPVAMRPVPIDTRGRLIKMEDSQYKREQEEYERKLKLEKEILKEMELETDIDDIEHFKRQAYLTVKNYSIYKRHKQQMKEAFENYQKRRDALRDHYKRHPEHETEWLPMLKKKLSERGEMGLYQRIEAGYNLLKNTKNLLDTAPQFNHVIDCECPGSTCSGNQSKNY